MGNCLGGDLSSNVNVVPQNSPDDSNDEGTSDWDSYEIGEKEIRSVFDAVFYVFDKESLLL